MIQAAVFICSMWMTGQGCSKLPSGPLQLKHPKMHSPTCSYLDAAWVCSKLKKLPTNTQRSVMAEGCPHTISHFVWTSSQWSSAASRGFWQAGVLIQVMFPSHCQNTRGEGTSWAVVSMMGVSCPSYGWMQCQEDSEKALMYNPFGGIKGTDLCKLLDKLKHKNKITQGGHQGQVQGPAHESRQCQAQTQAGGSMDWEQP